MKTIIAALMLDGDDAIVTRAARLARQHGARLVLLHVLEDIEPESRVPLPTSAEAMTRVRSEAAMTRMRALLAEAGLTGEAVVESGKPHLAIEALARLLQADLVVIGPGKPRGLRERVFGSTADRVVRAAPCPVLVVRAQAEDDYRVTLAAIDFSDPSLAAARALARLAPAARADLVHAVDTPADFQQALLVAGTPRDEVDRYRRARLLAARRQLRDFVAEAEGLPPGARNRVIEGAPGEVLIRLARRGEIEVIALGAQGAGRALSRLVLGSVARKVLTSVPCDVLVVPSQLG